jgi:hypothetical protein
MTARTWGRWLPRFSLRQLLLATAFVAVGCYALRWASPWWSIVLFYCGLTLVIGGILVAINWPGEPRSFWSGFAVCAIAHWLLVFEPGLRVGIPPLHPSPFVTTWLSEAAYDRAQPLLMVQPRQVDLAEFVTVRGNTGREQITIRGSGSSMRIPEFKVGTDGRFYSLTGSPHVLLEEDFVQVALGLWTLLLGYVGGHVSLALCRSRRDLAADRAD